MLCGSYLTPSLIGTSYFSSFLTKILLLLNYQNSCRTYRPLLHYHTYYFTKPLVDDNQNRFSMDSRIGFCILALSKKSTIHESFSPTTNIISNKANKKAHRESPKGMLRHKLDICSKYGDVVEALRLYDETRSHESALSQHHYNVLLYLCSSSSSVESIIDGNTENVLNLGLKKGFEIFEQMVNNKVVPNEATFTSLARLAVVKDNPKKAFDLVKQMKCFRIPPKLRSYELALLGLCKKGNADKAYAIDVHMKESGVVPEELELYALFKTQCLCE